MSQWDSSLPDVKTCIRDDWDARDRLDSECVCVLSRRGRVQSHSISLPTVSTEGSVQTSSPSFVTVQPVKYPAPNTPAATAVAELPRIKPNMTPAMNFRIAAPVHFVKSIENMDPERIGRQLPDIKHRTLNAHGEGSPPLRSDRSNAKA